jgi:CspA family cold shock protein
VIGFKQMIEQTTVLWFSKVRGFGFLVDPNGGQDIFVHYTQILSGEKGNRNLITGQGVTFERKTIKGKPVATGVRIVEAGE